MSVYRLLLPVAALCGPAFADEPDTMASSAALTQGHYRQVVTDFQKGGLAEASDPARLINLGTAYARLGDFDRASDAFRRAMYSDQRYDLELADGSVVDSREAARMALAKLSRDANRQTASR